MRRLKKKIFKILPIVLSIALVILIYLFFFKPRSKIDIANTTNQNKNLYVLEPHETQAPKIHLPEEIYTIDNNGNTQNVDDSTTYNVSTSSKTYLIATPSGNHVTVMLGNDSAALMTDDTPIQISVEYDIIGIEEPIKSTAVFNVNDYKYPIILLRTSAGEILYVDVESAFNTGKFEVTGKIESIPAISDIREITVTRNDEEYSTALLIDEDNKGYEFNLNMIGK